jgi:hypothetical protein
MLCVDSQKRYENLIFIDDFLEEIVGVYLKCSMLLDFEVFFLSTSAFLCTHFRPASVKKTLNSAAVVRKRTTPTELPPLVGEVSANLCG